MVHGGSFIIDLVYFLETLSSVTRLAGKELLPVFPIQSSPEMSVLGYVKGGVLLGSVWS